MAAGSSQTPSTVKTIETFLQQKHIDSMREMGYTFQGFLGEGNFGAAFRCQFTYMDPLLGFTRLERYAAKVVQIPYRPDLRPRTQHEVTQLGENQEIRITYRIKGQLVVQNVLSRRIETEISPDMIENPLSVHQTALLQRKADNIETEVNAMVRAEHENVIKLQNVIRFYDEYTENPFSASVVVFMELADGGDLDGYFKGRQCGEDECKQIMAQISCGVEHLHSRGIAHMDLKPENILVFNPQQNPLFKITDFGLSILFDPGSTPVGNRMRGTPLFRCPSMRKQQLEIQSGKRTEMCYDPTKGDIWALGIIIMFMMFGDPNIIMAYKQVTKPKEKYSKAFLRLLSTQQHSQLLDHLLKQVLVEDQDMRIGINEFCEHKWINDTIVAHKASIVAHHRQV